MDIDLTVLRSLESEKDISLDQAIKAIEDALLVAYHKSEGTSSAARGGAAGPGHGYGFRGCPARVRQDLRCRRRRGDPGPRG